MALSRKAKFAFVILLLVVGAINAFVFLVLVPWGMNLSRDPAPFQALYERRRVAYRKEDSFLLAFDRDPSFVSIAKDGTRTSGLDVDKTEWQMLRDLDHIDYRPKVLSVVADDRFAVVKVTRIFRARAVVGSRRGSWVSVARCRDTWERKPDKAWKMTESHELEHADAWLP